MAEKKPQTFANHTRFDPLFHFFALPVFLLLAIAGWFTSSGTPASTRP